MVEQLHLLDGHLPEEKPVQHQLHVHPVEGDGPVGRLEVILLEPSLEGPPMDSRGEAGLLVRVGEDTGEQPGLLLRGKGIRNLRGEYR